MKKHFKEYELEGAKYLHSTQDLAHHKIDGYLFKDELHLIQENDVLIVKIEKVKQNPDHYLWTPFIEFI